MDVFTQLGDAVGDLYATSHTSDHALNSPDLSVYAMSPTSIFMYEHDNEPIPLTKPTTDNMNTKGGSGYVNPLFNTPWSEEMTDLGCSLGDSFMSESSLCGSSLNDSVKDAVWDFAGYDDVSSPLQHPDDEFLHSPTLAELNMEDTQNFDAFNGGAVHPSAFSQQPMQPKTKPVLIKQNSHRHRSQDLTTSTLRKVQANGINNDKYSSLFTMSKSHPIQSNLHHHHHTATPTPQSQSLHNQIKTECLSLSKSSLPNRLSDIKSPSNCLSFSNLFGRRTKTFATSSSPQPKDQHKIVVKTEPVKAVDDSSMDRKWEEIKNFIHQDVFKVKMEEVEEDDFEDEAVSSPTKLTFKKHAHGYSVKSEKTELTNRQLSDDGFDSHDEGLGSEHEMDDGSEDEGVPDGAGLEDDGSDVSDGEDESGLTASSTQAGKYRGKSRRSEYDDMTPNPRKLLHIGNELRKLNKIISDMAPVSELSGNARNRCRKEKNKLASRACRLKKKAQHEANKIKLSGLDDEHTRLMFVLTAIKKDMVQRVHKGDSKYSVSLNHRLDNLIKSNLGQMVAGHTNEYVNVIMEKTARDKSSTITTKGK